MLICIVMQYIRTGILSNQADYSDVWTQAHAWIFPPIAILIGMLIGIVGIALDDDCVVDGLYGGNDRYAAAGRTSECLRRSGSGAGGNCPVLLSEVSAFSLILFVAPLPS